MRQRTGPTRTAHWVAPKLVAQVSFGSRTQDGRLRHSAFLGLREDKPPRDVVEEQAVPLAQVMHESSDAKPQRRRRGTATKSRRSGRPLRRNDAGAANDSLYDARKQEFDGVRLTSLQKVLYPEQGVTKLELARYYRAVADWILPHIVNRPLALLRCPEGRAKACFFQKHPGAGAPETLRQIPVREKQKTEMYVVVDDRAGLISLAQIGALELHAWGSRADKLEQPDRLVFDLDPDPQLAWKRVVASARQVRDFLGELGLESFVKTTGGKGLHIVVPVDRRHDWDETKKFCKHVADAVVAADPSTYTANMAKAARTGRIFIDYLRNGRGATAVVPYSTRAQPGATISTPLTWRELNPRLHSDRFNLRNIFRRLSSLQRDPWEEIDSVRQGLGGPRRILEALRVSQPH
jgi:bifunctional non-homologous end joining protein LigD